MPTEVGRLSRIEVLTPSAPFLALALSFGTSVLIARSFGADGRGWYAVATAAIAICAQFASLGFGEALAIRAIQGVGSPNPRKTLARIWIFYLSSAGILTALAPRFAAIVFGVATVSCWLQATSYALTMRMSVAWALALGLPPSVVLALTVAAPGLRWAVEDVLTIYVLAPLLGCLVVLLATDRAAVSGARTHHLRSTVSLGISRALSVSLMAVLRKADVVAVGILVSTEAAGSYAVASSLVELALLLPWVCSSRLLRQELQGGHVSIIRAGIQMALMTVPVISGVIAFGWLLIPQIWGPAFSIAYIYFLLMAPACLLLGALRGVMAVRVGRGQHVKLAARLAVISPVAVAGVCLGAIVGGPIGVAAVMSVASAALVQTTSMGTWD